MTRTISSSANRARPTKQGLSLSGAAMIAALVLSACFSTAPAAAASGNYCLSSDANNDCSFTSLAQCQATASGGLGECNMVVAAPIMRSRYAFGRLHR